MEVGGSSPPGDVVRLALRVATLPPHSSREKLLDTAIDEFERLALTKVEHVWTGRGKEEFFNVLRQLGANDNDPVWQEAESILFRARRGAEKSAVPAAPQVAQGALVNVNPQGQMTDLLKPKSGTAVGVPLHKAGPFAAGEETVMSASETTPQLPSASPPPSRKPPSATSAATATRPMEVAAALSPMVIPTAPRSHWSLRTLPPPTQVMLMTMPSPPSLPLLLSFSPYFPHT